MKAASERKRPWRPTTITIVALALLIGLNEAQRVNAQWQAHKERQAQLYQARVNTMMLDKLMQENDLQIELLTQHSTALDRLAFSRRERTILAKPSQ